MRLRFALMALAATAMSSGSAAQDPSKVAAAMDQYIDNPRGPGTYRALAGLGDPAFRASNESGNEWEDGEKARSLFEIDWGGDCRTDYALKTYRERLRRLGPNHPYVAQWVKVQRAVFSACKGWDPKRQIAALPTRLAIGDPQLDALQKADRAYQAASQLFYRSEIARARAGFTAIAGQPGPHRAAAAFMVVAIDAGSRAEQPADAKPGALQEAKALLASPKAAATRADAHELIGWMGATADTRATRAAQVAVTLQALHLPLVTLRSDPQAMARYDRSAQDLSALWTAFDNADWWLTGAVPKGYYGSLAMSEAAKRDRLAAFNLVPGPCSGETCPTVSSTMREFLEREQSNAAKAGDLDAWRVVAAELENSYGESDHWAEIDQLIGKVQRTPNDHDVALLALLADEQLRRAFINDSFDEKLARAKRLRAAALMKRWPWPEATWFTRRYAAALRNLAAGGQIAEARALRDGVGPRLADENRWQVPNELLMLLAEDRNRFVQVMADFKQSSSALIDRLPTRELVVLAQDPRLPAPARARLARVAWTRAYLTEQRMPRTIDSLMRSLNPEIAAAWHSTVGAKSDDHALLLDVLRTPAMNLRAASRSENDYLSYGDAPAKPGEIDTYQHSLNNWWCSPVAADYAEREESALAGAIGEQASRSAAERMLAQSWVWQSLDARERAMLAARAMAPRMLADAAVAWGSRADPKRPDGADEALALAVRATRYGCQMQGGHGAWSKAAWDVLHQRFPDTDAARRTRWWFDCKHFTYGCTDDPKDDQSAIGWADFEKSLDEKQPESPNTDARKDN